jgi:regulatory protein
MPWPMTATPSELSRRVVGGLAGDPRRPACVRVMVQGRPLLTIAREIAAAEGLAPGMVLEEPLYARLCRAADEEAAHRTALRLLERRPFAARDLARRLVLKGHSPEATSAAMARAQRSGLVDDVRFTLHYVETRAARGRGPLRLRRDLAALGVERGIVDRALADAFPGGSAGLAEVVEPLARKRLAQLRGVPRAAARRRLQSFLARRGYQGSAVQDLLVRLLSGS